MIKWIVSGIALSGVILNIQANRLGFLCWMISNFFWAAYQLRKKEYALSALFGVYFLLAIFGFIWWGR